MPRRGGVEHDVVVGRGDGVVREQLSELVERGDLDGAGSGQLLLDTGHGGVGQHAAVGADDPFAVRGRRLLGVDVQRGQPAGAGHWGRCGAGRRVENLVEVGCRVRGYHNSTRRPPSARAMAVAHAVDVLPTPPLPVKNR